MDFSVILKEQKMEMETILREENIIEREMTPIARNFLKFPNILAILGIRRCGKSIFSYMIAKDFPMAYINFDDERLIGIQTKDLNHLLQTVYELYGDVDYIVLDELQNIKGWELFVNRLRRTKRVILTGSNSQLLSGELASALTGRYLAIHLFPFSFKEYLSYHKFKIPRAYSTMEKAKILSLLREYLDYGGLPEVLKFGRRIIRQLYSNIITKDIISRYNIQKLDDFKNFANYIISNSTNEFSYNRLSNSLHLHRETIKSWIFYLENAFLIFRLSKFDYKLKNTILSNKKIYCMDNGIFSAIAVRNSPDMGKKLENLVAIELLRRKFLEDDMEVYFWKDSTHEVDFIIKKGNKVKELIQVSYVSNLNDVRKREVDGLLKAKDIFRCNSLTIITWDLNTIEQYNGASIRFIPLWKWLTE